MQRKVSTQIASNIMGMSRLQLLVEVLQRVNRMLKKNDQEKYGEEFAAYLKGHRGQYVYQMKRKDISAHLRLIGVFMQRLLVALQDAYSEGPVYQVLERVFGEHYCLEGQQVLAKAGNQLSASGLQSLDDLEATYRKDTTSW